MIGSRRSVSVYQAEMLRLQPVFRLKIKSAVRPSTQQSGPKSPNFFCRGEGAVPLQFIAPYTSLRNRVVWAVGTERLQQWAVPKSARFSSSADLPCHGIGDVTNGGKVEPPLILKRGAEP